MSGIDELGYPNEPLCREPWESYYVLRRGVMPCCYGATPNAPMSEWQSAWNSPALQDIRRHLVRGELSPYCLASLGCPVVQRYLEEQRRSTLGALRPSARSPLLRRVNRLLGGVPARLYRSLASWRASRERAR